MQFRGMSRSHLFLLELVVIILFFSFAGAITVQVFSKSHTLAQSTTALNEAVIAVQTAAETDKSLRFQDIGADQKAVYFNEDWEVTDAVSAVYTMTSGVSLEERPAGTMAVFEYTVTSASGDEIIYQLQSKKYYSGEAAGQPPLNEVN